MRHLRLAVQHLGDAEVAQLENVVLGAEDVLRFEVAVQHVLGVHLVTVGLVGEEGEPRFMGRGSACGPNEHDLSTVLESRRHPLQL
jgi:hypothetical protein